MLRGYAVVGCAALVAAHAEVSWPPARTHGTMATAGTCKGPDPSQVPQNGTCLWFSEGCTIGCSACIGEKDCMDGFPCCPANETGIYPMLNQSEYRTVFNVTIPFFPIPSEPTFHNPWRAPGRAPIMSPCGVAGGSSNADSGSGTGAWSPTGVKQGFDQREMPEVAQGIRAVWEAGSEQEVAWSMRANHGGGYSWRLCPKSENLTEDCFQRNHLKFVGNTSWIQYGATAISQGVANRTAIPAVRVSKGTYPQGSQWTRNPVPMCSGMYGGAQMNPGCEKPMFPPPMDTPGMEGVAGRGLYGYGQARCTSRLPGKSCSPEENDFWGRRFNFNLVDKIQVPQDLPAGEYLLSLRWDCEQTPQVWNGCADVTITH